MDGSWPVAAARTNRVRWRRRRLLWLVASSVALGGCASGGAGPLQPLSGLLQGIGVAAGQPTATPTTEPTATSALTPTPAPEPSPTVGPIPTAGAEATGTAAQPSGGTGQEPVAGHKIPSAPRLPPERLMIPRIGVDARVVWIDPKLDAQGVPVWETAAFAVGHHRSSANPGEPGNVVLSGHISSRSEGAVFKRLPELVVGDGVILVTFQQDYLYRVTKLATVLPSQVDALKPTPDETVTLITCVPDGVYTHRLIVTAKRVQP